MGKSNVLQVETAFVNANKAHFQTDKVATLLQEYKVHKRSALEKSIEIGKVLIQVNEWWKSAEGKDARKKGKVSMTLEDVYTKFYGITKGWASRLITVAKVDGKELAKFKRIATSDSSIGESVDDLVDFVKQKGKFSPAAKQQAKEIHAVERLGSVTVNLTKSGKVELSFNGAKFDDETLVAIINTSLAGGDVSKYLATKK